MTGVVSTAAAPDSHRRHLALAVLCLGVLMNTLNSTIVNVALPAIGAEFAYSGGSLVWVVNAYLAAYGGCLLLAGRLGDLFGHRRTLMCGIAVFAAASLGCGLATSPAMLIATRALQGMGGAIVSAMGLSLIAKLFVKTEERAKALGTYALVSACSGGIGMLVGGIMISVWHWHWLFLINVPVAITICSLSFVLLPRDRVASTCEHLDVGGAATVTAATAVGIYALLALSREGSNTWRTLPALAAAVLLLVLFIHIEARARQPLVPLNLFRRASLVIAATAGALLSAIAIGWTFVSALYLQRILLWTPLQTGLVFLPANVATAVMSFAVTPIIISRFGIGTPLVGGFALAGGGLLVLSASLQNAVAIFDVIPGMLLVGFGIGMTYSPAILGAVSGVAQDRAGIVSGIINTSFAVGGALGLAALAAIATATTDNLLRTGATLTLALQSGYQRAFHAGALVAAIGCLISAMFFHPRTRLRAGDDVIQQISESNALAERATDIPTASLGRQSRHPHTGQDLPDPL